MQKFATYILSVIMSTFETFVLTLVTQSGQCAQDDTMTSELMLVTCGLSLAKAGHTLGIGVQVANRRLEVGMVWFFHPCTDALSCRFDSLSSAGHTIEYFWLGSRNPLWL
jgi:hypothetical protein